MLFHLGSFPMSRSRDNPVMSLRSSDILRYDGFPVRVGIDAVDLISPIVSTLLVNVGNRKRKPAENTNLSALVANSFQKSIVVGMLEQFSLFLAVCFRFFQVLLESLQIFVDCLVQEFVSVFVLRQCQGFLDCGLELTVQFSLLCAGNSSDYVRLQGLQLPDLLIDSFIADQHALRVFVDGIEGLRDVIEVMDIVLQMFNLGLLRNDSLLLPVLKPAINRLELYLDIFLNNLPIPLILFPRILKSRKLLLRLRPNSIQLGVHIFLIHVLADIGRFLDRFYFMSRA